MNRRQFLGRFFQGVQTLYNSNYGYGAYHNWPLKYVPINIQVNCYYRRTKDEKNVLTNFMKQDTIIAIYDSSDKMIKCTAYYKDGVIINDFVSNGCVAYNLKPGLYTVKVLQSGKGINLTGSASITISANVDRTSVSNSNYGYVPSQNFIVEIVFDISGIYFNADSKLEAIGYWYPVGEKTSTYMSYYVDESNPDIRAENIALLQSWSSKMDSTQRYKIGPIYVIYSEIQAMELENISSSKAIGAMSMKDYPGMGSYITNNICINNNLDFDAIWKPVNMDVYYTTFNDNRISMETSEHYECMLYDSGMNTGNTVNTYAYVNADSYTVTGIANGGQINQRINSAKALTKTNRVSTVIDGRRYWTYKYRYLYVSTIMQCQEFMYGTYPMIEVKPTYSKTQTLDGYWGLPKTPPYVLYSDAEPTWNNISDTAKEVVQDTCKKYIYPALSNVDPANPASDEPWLKTETVESVSKNIPLDILFGYVTGCMNVIGEPSGGGGSASYHVEEMGSKFVIDGLSAYDPDKQINNDNMWIYVSPEIPALFLKQTPTPIDLDSIPDHKIG